VVFSRVVVGAGFALIFSFPVWASDLPAPSLADATDAAIPQDNIQPPVCVEGYTKTITPSANLMKKPGKRQSCKYGYTDARPKYYDEIHLIPPEDNPGDPLKLGPKPRINKWDVAKTEPPKFITYRMVCAQEDVTLAEVQRAIMANLIEAWKKLCVLRVTFLVSR
jgi:hypothetical protein